MILRWPLLTVLALVVAAPATAVAQDGNPAGVFPPVEERWQVLWRRLEGFADEGRWDAVLEGLREHAELVSDGDTNAVVSNGAGLALGVRRALGRIADRLPAPYAGRWRDLLDREVEKAWQETPGDPLGPERRRLRRRIVRDYPEASRLRDALLESVDAAFLAGDLERGRRHAVELLDEAAAGRVELSPEERVRTLTLLVRADRRLGDADAWRHHRARLDTLFQSGGMDPSGLPEPLRAQLEATLARAGEPGPASWPGSSRSSLTTSPTPAPGAWRLGGVERRVTIRRSELRRFIDERTVTKDGEPRTTVDVPIPFHPAVAAGVAFLRHEDRLVAWDLAAHRERWTYLLEPLPSPYRVPHAPLGSRDACYTAHGSQLHAVDARSGESLWVLEARHDPETDSLRVGPAGSFPAGPPDSGDEGAETRVRSVALSSPVFATGRLLLPAVVHLDREHQAFLLCIEPGGRLAWQTYLGSSQSGDFLGLGAAAPPATVARDRVLCLTNRGFVAAVDAHDGALLWVTEYPRLAPRGLREAVRDEHRWHPNPVVPLPTGEAAVAPQDSPWLLVLRQDDGAPVWRRPRERHATLLGHDGKRLFLGGRQVSAVGIRGEGRGRLLWSRNLGEAGPPQGRASLAGGEVLVSTRDALLHLDPQTGETVARDLWAFPAGGGNHVLAGKRLVVVHPGGFTVYNDVETERERLADLPVQQAETTLERGRFLLRTGEIESGLDTLESWLATKPETPEPNSSLDRLWLEVAEVLQSVAGAVASEDLETRLLRTRVELELRPSRKVDAAIRLARHLESAGDRGGALEALHRALEQDTGRAEFAPAGGLEVPAEAWIRDRIAELRAEEPDPETAFRELEEQALEELRGIHRRQGAEARSPVGYVELLRHYPYTEAAARAYEALVNYYRDYGNFGLAARYLTAYLNEFPDAPDAVQDGLRAAALLYRSGQRSAAKERYRQLLREHPGVAVRDVPGAQEGDTVRSYVERRLADPGLVDIELHEGPELAFPVRMLWRSPADLLAMNRTFLFPEGETPPELRDAFFTQSNEIVECRDLETGLPRWTVHLRMIPGFVLDRFASEFYFARSGDRVIRARFAGGLLVLHDHRNLFAVDPETGSVRWHVPLGAEQEDGVALRTHRLSERIRDVLVRDDGVWAATSRRRLYAFTLSGEKRWERDLDFDVARDSMVASREEVFVPAVRKAGTEQRLHGFRADDGEPTRPLLSAGDAGDGPPRHLDASPRALPGGRVLLARGRGVDAELLLVDIETRRTLWTWRSERSTVRSVQWSEEHPGEAIVVVNRSNDWPAIVGLSLRDGHEIWRYEKFGARATTIRVFRDDDRLFVIHGREQWMLLALEISRGANRGTRQVSTLWQPREVRLGTFFGSGRERTLHLARDAVIFPDSNSITLFGKPNGKVLAEPQTVLSRFLVDKGSFTSAVVRGRLVILSDGGDCAFGAADKDQRLAAARHKLERVRAYLADPGSLDAVVRLALAFFREGTAEGIRSALDLLDRACLSEDLLLRQGAEGRDKLARLQAGIREEALKRSPKPQIAAPRFRKPPTIDGELDDPWNYAYRVRLALPRHVGEIPRPGGGLNWEGEEDLSAVLYAGWDDQYFYFALDAQDDALRAYDRDAENWRGDCLIIGVDPDGDGGYRQGRTDQLMTLALTVPKRKKRGEDEEDPEAPQEGEEDEEDGEELEKPEGDFSVKKKDDDSGAIYEVALPWNTFSSRFRGEAQPQRGLSFGLSLLLTDDDTGSGATKTLSLNACHLLPRSQKQIWVWKYLIPEFFPQVVLR